MIIEFFAQNPTLWTIFQKIFGNDKQKEVLYRSSITTKSSLLDFGCSSGNTTGAFLDFNYTGLDIDKKSIKYAKKRWAGKKNIKFICSDILVHPPVKQKFDYILFATTGHHLSSDIFTPVTIKLVSLLKKNGQIWFYDILKPDKRNHFLTRLLAAIDRGKYLRTFPQYTALFKKIDAIKIVESKTIVVQGSLIPQEDYCFFRLKKR
ncbi:hypothetical protein A3J19_04980 [Candidatus Daviesbacteria bacterium RIFCSPLOWO2_02_FULL_41_8]|uniref:Methyltransferase domain-containing protein n=1 Tax=Candidatus Daviesbacteria bacterium RIFCSPLOWO2_02_FULL_41_8 TaxID=1797798 RepID=A0A1F5NIY2_9BACT|nr:MAG: hypothetical protein A3J19_04980 [Candidatus Daviesbacteria bacterium RIFCSPLOWO2_02_FULL_41_8]